LRLEHILVWVLPPLTLAMIAFCVFWYRLFTRYAFYSDLRNRPKRRRRRRPSPLS
jgi:hypothetical protein